MSMDQLISIISSVGFPIVSTICLGVFINQVIKNQREDFKRREELLVNQINTLTHLIIGFTNSNNKGGE